MIKKFYLLSIALCCTVAVFAQKISYDVQVRNYIDRFKEFAILEQLRSGVPASITLAQGVVETAAGCSELCTNAQNHFGIKCKNTWTGETYAYTDDAKDECFRKYESALISYKDHSDFLKGNKRYAGLFQLAPTDYTSWAYGLKKCGYATNPKYAQKLIEIIETYNLQDYTFAALSKGNNGNNPVMLASAAPVAAAGGYNSGNNTATQAAVVATGADNNDWEVIRTSSPAEQKAEESSSSYYEVTRKNGLKGFQAKKGDMLLEYAIKNRVRYAKLLEMNDLPDAPLEADMFIYLEKKNKAAENPTHVVENGETMLQISQQEGIQLQQLKALNGISGAEEPVPGSVLNLQTPATEKPDVSTGNIIKQEEEVSFGYGAAAPKANDKKTTDAQDGWVATATPIREISDDDGDNAENNIANLSSVEEEARTEAAPVAQDIDKRSVLDKLKEKMDKSVYSNNNQDNNGKSEEEYDDPATVPAYTQNPQSRDPNDALRRHMQNVKNDEGEFVPKQNKDQSERVKNMPVSRTTTERAVKGRTSKNKAVAKGKKGKAAVKAKGKAGAKKAKAASKTKASKSKKEIPAKGKKAPAKKKKK